MTHSHFWGMITIATMLKKMETGQPFSCRVVTFDQKRKKGGAKRYYEEAKLVQKQPADELYQGRPLTALEKQSETTLDSVKRDPNHRHWYTRNIRLLHNGLETMEIKKIHPPLVIEFNGEKVTP